MGTKMNEVNEKKIQERMRERKVVEELIEFIESYRENEKIGQLQCWERLVMHARQEVFPKDSSALFNSMTDAEARQFESKIVPFGAKQGMQVGDVEPSYWSAITEGEFSKELRRYLASDRYRRLQD